MLELHSIFFKSYLANNDEMIFYAPSTSAKFGPVCPSMTLCMCSRMVRDSIFKLNYPKHCDASFCKVKKIRLVFRMMNTGRCSWCQLAPAFKRYSAFQCPKEQKI